MNLIKGRISDLLVTRFLRVGKNASMKVVNSDGTESLINMGVQIVTGATTLTAVDSGKTIVMNAAGGGAITLPEEAKGLRFRFVVGATAPTTAWTVVTASNGTTIYGSTSDAAGTAAGAGSAEDTITFAANVALPGDMVDIISDGTNWYAHGQSAAAAAITMTDEA